MVEHRRRLGHEAGGPHDDPVKGVERAGGAVVVHLAGELDLHNAGAVRDALHRWVAERPERLVVDLAGVEFIDSTALGVLVEAQRGLHDGHPLYLAAPGLAARRALEVTGLDRHFAVHESVAEALAATHGAAPSP